MDLKIVLLLLATVLLLTTSFIYGLKFLKVRNYLLGGEWLVVALSSANLLAHLLSGAQLPYEISMFCDAFSRGFGIPVIAVAGLMAVTHHYEPSKLTDILFFVLSIAATAVFVSADFLAKLLPYFYLLMWTAFSIYLAYFAYRLMRVGKNLHAIGVIVALILGQAIALMEEFFKIPGDEDKVIFFTLALTTWAYMGVQMYYSYFALERAEPSESPRKSEVGNRTSGAFF